MGKYPSVHSVCGCGCGWVGGCGDRFSSRIAWQRESTLLFTLCVGVDVDV